MTLVHSRKQLFVGLVALVGVLAGSAWVGFLQTQRLFRNSALVAHTHEAPAISERVMASLTDAETSLTDESAVLSSFVGLLIGLAAVGAFVWLLMRYVEMANRILIHEQKELKRQERAVKQVAAAGRLSPQDKFLASWSRAAPFRPSAAHCNSKLSKATTQMGAKPADGAAGSADEPIDRRPARCVANYAR